MTEASQYLLSLARRVATPYQALPQARASMVTGSVADGLSDYFSDIDMAIYYETLPGEEMLVEARVQNGAPLRKWAIGDRNSGGFIEAYMMGQVECQLIHSTLEGWEQNMAVVLEQHEVTSPLNKAMSGMQKCIPLYGDALIQRWKDRINDFPPELAEKMVRHYLNFFPVWALLGQFTSRDATLFYQQSVLEAAQNLLGVLSGLNRVYYSTFQFKRMGKFIDQLGVAPPHLAQRIESLFQLPMEPSSDQLRTLVGETIALVDAHMPQVDTSKVKGTLERRLEAWKRE